MIFRRQRQFKISIHLSLILYEHLPKLLHTYVYFRNLLGWFSKVKLNIYTIWMLKNQSVILILCNRPLLYGAKSHIFFVFRFYGGHDRLVYFLIRIVFTNLQVLKIGIYRGVEKNQPHIRFVVGLEKWHTIYN